MMLRFSFDLDQEADAIEAAVAQVLKEGYRTIDIMSEGKTQVGPEAGKRVRETDAFSYACERCLTGSREERQGRGRGKGHVVHSELRRM